MPDYAEMIAQAIRYLYVATGRATQYSTELVIYNEEMPVSFAADLAADEAEFILVTAEIGYYRRVQTDVNRIVGYATDALTITNADKPYANISQTIAELMNKQRILYYKMVRFSLL